MEDDLRPGGRCPACNRARTAANLQTWACSRVECPMRAAERQHQSIDDGAYEPLWDGAFKARPTNKE